MADTPDSGSGSGSVSNPLYSSSSLPKTPNLRAEIDTSPPFGSVKEAVTHFESSGAWIHLHKLGFGDAYLHNVGDIDIKKVEEQTLELEKDLIVKELETLDVLEELGTTKRMVEDLKWQLQKEALKCMAISKPSEQISTPNIGEVNKENHMYLLNGCQDKLALGSSSPCPISSPDMILMELNQAKLNLGKTINELGSIQTSVESLNMKIKREKALLEKTRQKMALKSSAASEQQKVVQQRTQPQPQHADNEDVRIMDLSTEDARELHELNFKHGQFEEEKPTGEQAYKNVMRMAEMKLAAAKKMEEAAKAAEAVAIAEIKALSGNNEGALSFLLPDPDISIFTGSRSPMISKARRMQKKNTRDGPFQGDDGVNFSRLNILKKLDDATEEVKLSKQALEEALQRVEIANRKQLAAGEALRKWAPENRPKGGNTTTQPIHSTRSDHPMSSPLVNLPKPNMENESESKPVLRSNLSMRDVLSRKQVVLPEDYAPRRQTEGRKVALSQMLNELREDITFPSRPEAIPQKQYMAQRKKFGFIHISLPLTKPSRKNAHNSDLR